MTLVDMYDGVNVSQWPAGVTHGLVYTDGRFANRQQVLNRFPGIVLQTISAVGTGPAMWIDCEPGCVWPPNRAVFIYLGWRNKGCRGIYCQQSVKAEVRALASAAGVTPEIFGADWTGVRHINPDEAQTQYMNTHGYDVSAIPGPAAPAPRPAPAPIPLPEGVPPMPRALTPVHIVQTSCAWNPNRDGGQLDVIMVGVDGKVYHVWYDANPNLWYGPETITDPSA